MLRRINFRVKQIFRALGRATGSSHQIALGMAIGFFVGWLPIVGIQMAVALVVCQIAHANRVVPIFPIWLTNPVTIIPVYSFNYWVGWLVVGGPPLGDLVAVLRRMIVPPEAVEGMGRMQLWWRGLRHGLGELLGIGWEMQLPLWLGCVIVGTALAVPAYFLTAKTVDAFRLAIQRKRERREARSRRRRAEAGEAAAGVAAETSAAE